VFDFVGVPSVCEQDLAMPAVGGALFLVGTTDPLTTIQVPIVSAVLNQIRVQGVNFGSANFTRDIPVYLDLYGRGRMNLDDLVSREISLDELLAAYDMLDDPDSGDHFREVAFPLDNHHRVDNPAGQRPHRRDVSAPIRSETVTSSNPFPGLWHTRSPARIEREGAGARPLRCVHDGAVATDGLPRSPSSVLMRR
jgi:hypothetical protein